MENELITFNQFLQKITKLLVIYISLDLNWINQKSYKQDLFGSPSEVKS